MRFWISGEVFHEVGQEYLVATNAVSEALNAELGDVDYGIPVKSWNVIGVVLPSSIHGFEEVRRYEPDKREVEFRIRIYYPLFQEAECPGEREWLILDMILQSVDWFREMADLPPETID